jgi:hypothetical protein
MKPIFSLPMVAVLMLLMDSRAVIGNDVGFGEYGYGRRR